MNKHQIILDFIKKHKIGVISTVSPEGQPEAAVIEFGKTDELEVIFAQRINPSFRRKVYLKAWADTSPDCRIRFKNIAYILWS